MVRTIPLILLSITLLGYWGRVLRMAYKSRRQTGRAANIVPAEMVGRIIRVLWFPVIVVWIVYPLVVAGRHSLPFALTPYYCSPWIGWPGVLIVSRCLGLTRLCWKTMGKNWRMGIDPGEQNPLIAGGPFSRVRHPIYALSALMMLTTMAMLPSPLMLATGCVHIGLLVWESRREEKHMLSVHGEAYREYCRSVGGFFPRSPVIK